MGASDSKLYELSSEDISSFVTNLGGKYHSYGDTIDSNAVDGEVLMEIEDTDEFKETLKCLNITNFVHQKVLTKEWRKAKTASSSSGEPSKDKGAAMSTTPSVPSSMTSLRRSETSFTVATLTDASEITMDQDLTSLSTYCRPINIVEKAPSMSPLPLAITLQHKQKLEPLDLPKSIELLPPDDPVLEPFHRMATKAMGDLKGSFAQVNLLDIEMEAGTNQKGVNNLTTVLPTVSPGPMRMHFDQPTDFEICRKFILGSQEDFHIDDLPIELSSGVGMKEPAKYYGHVVQYGNLRVGTICICIEETPAKATSPQHKQEVLGFLATLVKGQLEKREALLQRKHNLKEDLRQAHQQGADPILAPPVGPLRAVTASQVAKRKTIFPYPQEPGQHPNGCPTQPQFTRRSATLPAFHIQATQEERCHLKPTYYDHPAFHGTVGQDHTPVGKQDMERVALVQSLQLMEMDPLSQEAQTIQSLVELAGGLLKADFAFVTLLDHQHCHLFFLTYPQGPWPQMQSALEQGYSLVRQHPQTGEAFHLSHGRATSICNYALATPDHQSFVVHDLSQDQSLACFNTLGGFGFYSGSPIVIQGMAVGCLCFVCKEPNHEFGRVQEIQQEQFAQLIAQQYETWALNREVQQLERERNLFLTPSTSCAIASPPEDYAAMVFTSVQGIAAMSETNPSALDHASGLHNQILESTIAELGGYRIASEGNSFHVAFSDVVDAVQFCLKTQEALHGAPWNPDLLALPQAQDNGAFRGLRVKMSIHCGAVECSYSSQAPGLVTYSGETFHIGKNLESMAHGGQILITSDVWNVAAPMVESALGSPQVLDLGTHVVPFCSSHMHDGVATKRVLQLVPASFAHDYLESRRLGGNGLPHSGRSFPRIKTKKSISTSFHDAPFAGNKVCLVYADTTQVETMAEDSGLLLAALSKRIGGILQAQQPDGYQCQDFMVAFEESAAAIRFGIAFQESLDREDVLDVSLKGQVRIGVHEGIFDSMRPNPMSGKAEYIGSLVDQVILIAQEAAPGCVCLGKEAEPMDEFNLQPVTNGFMLEYAGRKSFGSERAQEEEFSLYKCQPCKSWYDQMVDNRNGRNSLQSPWRGHY